MTERVHLVGVGGSGMQGLARLLATKGYEVTGSDLQRIEIPGVETFCGHRAEQLPAGAGILVHTPAVEEDNPELLEARKRNLKVFTYPEMVGHLMKDRVGISVAGSHGKTTTSAMISYILQRAGLEPSYICGSLIPQLGGSAGAGEGRHFVAEACEYRRSFLHYPHQCAVITNIEEEHLDYYRDLEEIQGAFLEFARRVGPEGTVIGSVDTPGSAEVVREFKDRGETYSVEGDADWRARNIEVRDGHWTFEVLKYGKPFGTARIALAGKHNISNALAAICVATWAGVGQEIILLALEEFEGVERRLQVVGERGGAVILDDYAHHPTEIQATLRAVRERYPNRKIWCVFQPHLYSRTRRFMNDFARSFTDADLVLLAEVFPARTGENERKISAATLAQRVDENGKAALFLSSFEEVERFLKDKMTSDCVIITMGAGDIGEVARRLVD